MLVSRRNYFASLLLLVVATLAMTSACSGSDPGDTSDAAAPPSSATPSSPPATGSTGSTDPTTPAPQASSDDAPATCATGDLAVDLSRDAGGGSAGATHSRLTFTNTSSAPCTMTGWPGVAYVGDGDGTQIGAAADRTGTPGVLTLRPRQTAVADLTESDPGAHGCMASSDGLRVYPPNNRDAVFVRHAATSCEDPAEHLLEIGPVHRP